MTQGKTNWITPIWPAPANIQALVTSRQPPLNIIAAPSSPLDFKNGYADFNLATHVGDQASIIQQNREHLSNQLGIPNDRLCWLEQVHGQNIISAEHHTPPFQADGCDTEEINLACIVMTADCLPVLLCNTNGTKVSAIHAGWRGLASGILTRAIQRFSKADNIIAWLGPAISQKHFEVGEDVYQAFVNINTHSKAAFIPAKDKGKWMADIYQLARLQLQAAGVVGIYGGDLCTFNDTERFYSYRRDGAQSGRMASIIVIK